MLRGHGFPGETAGMGLILVFNLHIGVSLYL